MSVCIIMRERKKECEFGWARTVEDMGGAGRRNTIIKIYCMKKIYFQFKKPNRQFVSPLQVEQWKLQSWSMWDI